MKIFYEFLSTADFSMIFNNKDPKELGISTCADSYPDLKFDKVVEIVFGRDVILNESASEEDKLKLKSYYYNIPDEVESIKYGLEERKNDDIEEELEVVEYNGILDLKHLDLFFEELLKNKAEDDECYIFFSGGNAFPFTFYMMLPEIISKYKLIAHPLMVDSLNEALNDPEAFSKINNIGSRIFEDSSGNIIDISFDEIFTVNENFTKVKYLASQAALSDIEILLQGKSGTGKELFAKAIHTNSGRKGKFVAINCAAFPEGLIDSELFGHVKGSFTGAYKDKEGIFEVAKGGTVFLDEVADMPRLTQVKLLRALEIKKIRKVGDTKEEDIDVRIISATNKDMNEEVINGNFRQDLYFRLKKFELTIPPLSERGDKDIAFIFMKVCNKRKFPIKNITESASRLLLDYDFPGNVRELISIVECAIIYSKAEHKDIDDDIIRKSIGLKLYQDFEARKYRLREEKEETNKHAKYKYIMKQFVGDVNFYEGFTMKVFLMEVDKHYIVEALRHHKTQKEAGKALGYTQQVISNKILKYNIDNRQVS